MRCPHTNSVHAMDMPGLGKWQARCERCLLAGGFGSDAASALQNFWITDASRRAAEESTRPRPTSFRVPYAAYEGRPDSFDRRYVHPVLVYRQRWSTVEEEQDELYRDFIFYAKAMGFKDSFRLVEKPRKTEFNPVFGAPYGTNSEPEVDGVDFYSVVNGTYYKLQEKTVAYPPNPTPYWTIVSDEGPADKPRRHSSKSSAETEAQRLTEKHPGREFTVFQAVSSVLTPKAETKKTEYREVNHWAVQSLFYNPYDPRN